MRLYTIQPIEVVNELKNKGYFKCNYNLSTFKNDNEFYEAYCWMSKKMKEKIGEVKGIDFPIWAWRIYEGKVGYPAKDEYQDTYKTEYKIIECEIPDDKVVLSDFDNWHYVIGKWWLDDSNNEDEYNKNRKWFEKLTQEEQSKIIEKSWDKIFKVDRFENEWIRRGIYVQATFWELKIEDVINILDY